MGLFSGLEELGLGKLKNVEVFNKEAEVTDAKGTTQKVVPKEEDVLFDKKYTCPICDKEFISKAVRTGKVKLNKTDTDLRPIYEIMEPIKYDAVVCTHCGYSALSRFFPTVTNAQAKIIREKISSSFKGLDMNGAIYSYDEAITRYKLALVNTVMKNTKASEKAYTCLKLAWLYRSKSENLPADTPDIERVKKELASYEAECIENAYEGFVVAFSKENFPMCGMDEHTVTYLVAELARRCGKYDEASRWISQVIVARDANERIKEKARDIKELIVKQKKQQ